MSNSFLDKVANQLLSEHRENLHEILVILPSRRSGVFLRKKLAEKVEGPSWLPEITSMDEFIEKLSGTTTSDPLSLAFELYLVYQELKGEGADSFDKAMTWIPSVIADFSDIDMALVEPLSFFKHLSDAKKLEEWNPDGSDATGMQQAYLKFWEELGEVYHAFNKKLDELNIAYRGKAFRAAASASINNNKYLHPYQGIWFCGLNALTRAEIKLIKNLRREGIASVFWDTDKYFLESEQHEAAKFLKKNLNEFPENHRWIKDDFGVNKKHFRIIGSAGKTGQAKLIQHLLTTEFQRYNDIAIVLADESLLDPLLASLPQDIGSLNITLGLPLEYQPVASWVRDFLAIYSNRVRYYNGAVYHADLTRFLQHPLSTKVFGFNEVEHIVKDITENNLNYLRPARLNDVLQNLTQLIVEPTASTEDLANRILSLLKQCTGSCDKEKEPLFHAGILASAKAVKTAKHYLKSYPGLIDISMFAHIYERMIAQEQINFVGEPLSGLQIMGMLETRALSFDKVILAGANEGILPKGKDASSLIPNDLKYAYNIPKYDDKDSIFAYHFYRLIASCSDAWLLYNTRSEDYGSSEMSRFLTQLRYEHPENITLTEKIYQNKPDKQSDPVIIQSTPSLIDRTTEVIKNGISASAINTYLTCPLDFYYRYILRLKEEDKVEEDVEHSTFGSILHQALEDFYIPFKDKWLSSSALLGAMDNVPELVEKAFQKEMKSADIGKGINLVSRHVIEDYVNRFIRMDAHAAKRSKRKIIGLEEKLTAEITVSNNLKGTFTGVVDRIEEREDGLYVIDYKSGVVNQSDVSSKILETAFNGGKPKALQLLLYGILVNENFSNTGPMFLGNYSFQQLGQGLIKQKSGDSQDFYSQGIEDIRSHFAEVLQQIIGHESWVHNESAKFCAYCDTGK